MKVLYLVKCFITLAFLCITSVEAVAQFVVTGTVADQNGGPFEGVSVTAKESGIGTATDKQGKFSITVSNEREVLLFSSVGYENFQLPVGTQRTLAITMRTAAGNLTDVVVVGYGTSRKANLTGAVTVVDSRRLENRPITNVASGLQGLAPGLSVTRQTGQPGNEGVNISIRGATTANGQVNPLVVLDGIITNTSILQSINPNDIESISILKDAAAAAIYGAQSAGGVIVITTKKGKDGKTIFDYSGQLSTSWGINVAERLPLLEEALYANLARTNSGTTAEYSETDLQRIRDGIPYVVNATDSNQYEYYNQGSLVDRVLRKNTVMQTHNISARGGTDRLGFLASFGFLDQNGILKVGPDRYNRYNSRLNLNTKLTKHLSFDTRLSYTVQKQEAPSSGVNGNATTGGSGAVFYQIYRLRNRNPFFTPEGRYNTLQDGYGRWEAGGFNKTDRNNANAIFELKLANFIKGLQLRGVYGATLNTNESSTFNRTVAFWNRNSIQSYRNNPNSYNISRIKYQSNNIQFLADYDFDLGANHSFHILGGYQWDDSRLDDIDAGVSALTSNDLPALALGDDKTRNNNQTITEYATQSYFSRLNYNYADKYLAEATLRADESSQLAPGLRIKYFPSLSVGWKMQRENWFAKILPFFSEFKLRASWGRLGNAQGIGAYDYLPLLSRGNNLVLGTPETRSPYYFQSSIPSSSLSWETVETTNGGADIGLLSNKLQISADYYVKFNRNMLTQITLPSTLGVNPPFVNNGELKSWGWEVETRYSNKIGKDFNYSIAFNLSDNQSKLLNYGGRKVLNEGPVSLLEGYPLRTLWGYRTDSYFSSAGEVTGSAFQDNRTGPGDVRYVDLDKSGRITAGSGRLDDPGDLVYLGTTDPRYLFGLNLGMQWKGLDLTMFFQGVGKRVFRPYIESLMPYPATYKNALAIHRDYWTPDNPDAFWPRPYLQGFHNYKSSDKWALNGQYIRLKNLQLGYNLPTSMLSKVKISRLRVFFSAQDILTLSKLGVLKSYYDPETRQGVDNDYPYFASAAFGLNITF